MIITRLVSMFLKIRSMKRRMLSGKHMGISTTHTAGRMKTGGNILINIMQSCGRRSRITEKRWSSSTRNSLRACRKKKVQRRAHGGRTVAGHGRGIFRNDIEGMRVRIGSNGDVSVDGIEEEVRRYLKGVTGEDISLENLYLTPDGKIGGLPEKAAYLINKTKDNAKIEQMKDALVDIIGNIRISGGLEIFNFTSQFQFKDGAFAVADSGFAVDMGALDDRLTPQSSVNMYSNMHKYQFRKVL